MGVPDDVLRAIMEDAMRLTGETPQGIVVVSMGELLDPTADPVASIARDILPEPNCDDPDCEGCMALRRLRGESLDPMGIRPSDGPPIII